MKINTGIVYINGVGRTWLYSIPTTSIYQGKLKEYEACMNESGIRRDEQADAMNATYMLVESCLIAWDCFLATKGKRAENSDISMDDIVAMATNAQDEFFRAISEISKCVKTVTVESKKKLMTKAEM